MKITMIEIEATAEDLRSNRTIGETFISALASACERINGNNVEEETEEEKCMSET